jgi:hypothetical protein
MLTDKINKNLMEAGPDFVYGRDIDEKTLTKRKTTLARVIQQAEVALKKAEADGDDSLADKLRKKIQELQDLLDNAHSTASSEDEDEGKQDSSDDGDSDDSDEDGDTDGEDEDESEGDDEVSHGEGDKGNSDEEGDTDSDGDGVADNDEVADSQSKNGGGKPKGSNSSGNSNGDSEDDESDDSDDDESGDSKGESDDEDGEEDEEGGVAGKGGNGDEDGDDSEGSSGSEGEGDEDDGDDDDGDSDTPKIKNDTILRDPFNDGVPRKLPANIQQQLDNGGLKIEDELEAVKRILSKLSGDARRGAGDAVKDFFKENGIDPDTVTFNESVNRKLTEATRKSISQMSDEEFHEIINGALDLIDQNTKVDYSTDLDARVAEIKQDASNPLKNRELDQEDNDNLRPERQLARAREKENQRYRNFKSLDSFKINFYRAIKDQVEKSEDEDETWSVINRRTEDDPSIVKKGTILDDADENIPSIDVYFDQSGSWGDNEVKIGQSAISVINEFADRGEIKLNIYYFANHVHSDSPSARAEGGTAAWPEILQNIKATKARNVVIMTDSDVEWSARNGDRCIVEGCVWYIWKNNSCAESAPKKLFGRTGTFQYSFRSY